MVLTYDDMPPMLDEDDQEDEDVSPAELRELNMQLGLIPMDLKDWLEPFRRCLRIGLRALIRDFFVGTPPPISNYR